MSVIASVLFMLVSVFGLGGAPVDHGYEPSPLTVSCVSAPQAVIELGGSCGPVLLGDDNGDGFVDEDESGWDCRTMGNRVCGPVM